MRWLYHKTHKKKVFEDDEVESALSNGWVKVPKDLWEKPDKKPEEKPKYLSQMNVSELIAEGLKHNLTFTDESKKEMREIISKARD